MTMTILKPEESGPEAGELQTVCANTLLLLWALRVLHHVSNQKHEDVRHSVANLGPKKS